MENIHQRCATSIVPFQDWECPYPNIDVVEREAKEYKVVGLVPARFRFTHVVG